MFLFKALEKMQSSLSESGCKQDKCKQNYIYALYITQRDSGKYDTGHWNIRKS